MTSFSRHGLRDYGDGSHRGTPLKPDELLLKLADSANSIALTYASRQALDGFGDARRTRDESKQLTRLHLLKELFNVFLNRAVSLIPSRISFRFKRVH